MVHRERWPFSGVNGLDVNITDCEFLLAAITLAAENGGPVACKLCAANNRSVVAEVSGVSPDQVLKIVGRDACYTYREEAELDGTVK